MMKFDDCCCCLPTDPVIAYNSRTRVFYGDKLIYKLEISRDHIPRAMTMNGERKEGRVVASLVNCIHKDFYRAR